MMFVYKIHINPILTILNYGIYYDFRDSNGAVLKKFQSMAIQRILKINNSWPELFNFQNLNGPERSYFKNNVEKGENIAGNRHFLLFPHNIFFCVKRDFNF